ncbi:MAG: glycosyltransferase [Patescibacteria group bacterium]
MNYISEWATAHPEDPTKFFQFEKFNGLYSDFIFIAGIFDFTKLNTISNNKRVVYFDLEEPNRFLATKGGFDRVDTEKKIFKTLSICPYTTKWINERDQNDSHEFVFIPLDEELIPKILDNKIYDINYSGHILSNDISKQIDSILKYNYRFISRSNDPRVTDKNISYREKLDIISKCKITLVHNLLFLRKDHIKNLKKINSIDKNFAFKNVFQKPFWSFFGKLIPAPQIKTRTFEAAFCKSLILCLKDDFNVIEYFFKEGEEFIYYKDKKELGIIIKDVLSNYDKYIPIIENAFNKAINNYTTKIFAEKYLSQI